MVGVGQAHERGAEQRPALEVEGTQRVLGGDPQCFALARRRGSVRRSIVGSVMTGGEWIT